MRPTTIRWAATAWEGGDLDLEGHIVWLRKGWWDTSDVLLTMRDLPRLLGADLPNVTAIRTWRGGLASGAIWVRLTPGEVAAFAADKADAAEGCFLDLLDRLDTWFEGVARGEGWQEVDARWDPLALGGDGRAEILTPDPAGAGVPLAHPPLSLTARDTTPDLIGDFDARDRRLADFQGERDVSGPA